MRSFRCAAVAAAAALQVGCYTLQPTGGGAPTPGTQIAFDLNDAGRVALGGTIGPSIAQLEGRLVRADAGDYLVAVSSVKYLTGGTQVWSGEPVRVRPEHVGTTYQRRLSKSRTIAAGAIGIGAVAFLVTRSIIGGGSTDLPPVPGDSGVSLRPWR